MTHADPHHGPEWLGHTCKCECADCWRPVPVSGWGCICPQCPCGKAVES